MRRRRRRASQPACARAHAPAYTCRSQCARWLIPALLLLSASTARTRSASRRATAPAARNPPRLLHLGQQSRARSSASLFDKSCSRLCHLLSPGSAASSPATVGHGVAVLGRHGRPLPPLLQPRLATLPPSPSSREPRAPANSPYPGWQWPPASWPSRAAATSQRRRGIRLGRARPKGHGPTPCRAASPFPLRSGRAGQMWPWAS